MINPDAPPPIPRAVNDLLDTAAGRAEVPYECLYRQWYNLVLHQHLRLPAQKDALRRCVAQWRKDFGAWTGPLPKQLVTIVFHARIDGGCVDLKTWQRKAYGRVWARIDEVISYPLRGSMTKSGCHEWVFEVLREAASDICRRYQAFVRALRIFRPILVMDSHGHWSQTGSTASNIEGCETLQLPIDMLWHLISTSSSALFAGFTLPSDWCTNPWADLRVKFPNQEVNESINESINESVNDYDCSIRCANSLELIPTHSWIIRHYLCPTAVRPTPRSTSDTASPQVFDVVDELIRPVHVHMCLKVCYAPAKYDLPNEVYLMDDGWLSTQEALAKRILCNIML
jgi:hypothetical protein